MTDYTKRMFAIHFQKPDMLSRTAVVSFATMYPDWDTSLYTDEVDSWVDFVATNSLSINVYSAKAIESEYKDKASIFSAYNLMRSDLLRAYILYSSGGMYFDTDLIATKALSDILFAEAADKTSILIPEEKNNPETKDYRTVGYTNAWMYVSDSSNLFFRLLLDGYCGNSLWQQSVRTGKHNRLGNIEMKDDYVTEYAVAYPYFLATHVVPYKVILQDYRQWYYPHDIYSYIQGNHKIENYPEALGFHLWRSAFYKLGLQDCLTENWVVNNPDQLLSQLVQRYSKD